MLARSLIIPLTALCAFPAIAQSGGAAAPREKPSVEGYLCTFAGKCDGATTETVSRDAPVTKGFRLARPAVDAAASSDGGGVNGGGVKRVAGQPVAVMVRGKPRNGNAYGAGPRRIAGAGAAAVAGAGAMGTVGAVGRPRADLMIGFDLNSAKLSADGVTATQIFAKSLLTPELKSKRFLIEGHTDLRGTRDINMALSRARAKAVADYLVILGVQPERLQTRGFGPDVPLPGHRSTDPTNRRVEAELIS
ncbi:MAG: OmpA family protein [Pseudomonadota bacterium]|uniref:OmpA family protein n=1 Tax=Sphingomonas sp. ERG5 TaxID=1381597 RepID=UPI000B04387B|nr:OmpA family protein [Sphingomonas sp. ERG5]